MTDYACDYDHDGDQLIIRDTPGGSLGVWNTGLETWQSAGLTVAEVDVLVASGEFRWQRTALRDRLGLSRCGPFVDEGTRDGPESSDTIGTQRRSPQTG